MHKEFKVRTMTYNPYIEGVFYEDKGTYLGISKGSHKFQRHSKPFYQKRTFGPRFHFEVIK